MTASALLLPLYTACVAAIQAAAIWLRRPISRTALLAVFGLPLLFLLPGFFSATTPLPTDHTLGYWPWHVVSQAPARNANLNDIAAQFAPWEKAVRLAYKSRELPLRDRWNGCGTPLAANGQSAAYSPFTLIGLILPLARAATLAGALKLALALAGMWLWLRELRIRNGAALFGAVAFAFSMLMIPWLFFPQTAAICLWPWALFAVELLRDRAGAGRAFALLVAIFTVWPLCGHIESVALGSAFIGLWLAARAAARELPDGRRILARIAAAAALALALCAFALLPHALAIHASNRFAQVQHPIWSGSHSWLPRLHFWWQGILALFFPRIFGDAIAAPMIAGGAGSFPEMALGSFGLVGWVLALSIFRRGSRRARAEWALLVPMALGLCAAVGLWPFAEIAGALPLLKMTFPLRFLSWLSLAGPAVAAFEIDRLRRDLRARQSAWIFPAGTALALAGLAVWAFRRFEPLHAAAGGWVSERRAWIFSELILAAVAAALALLGTRRLRTRQLSAALTMISAAALFWEGERIYRFDSIARLYPETPLVKFLAERPKPFRIVGEGAVMFPNSNVFAGVEDVRTHDPVERRDYVEFLDANCGYDPAPYFKKIRDVNAPALDLLNVRYLVSDPGRSAPAPKWNRVYSGADGTVFENSGVRPRFFPAGPSAILEISRYRETTNRIEFRCRVSGSRPALVAGSIVQDGGWTGSDRTGPLAAGRFQGIFLAFALAPGDHDVRLDYSPPGFLVGSWISAAALVLLILGVFIGRVRARRSPGWPAAPARPRSGRTSLSGVRTSREA